MPAKKYCITLTEAEQEGLNAAAHSNNITKTIRIRASVLLMADVGCVGSGFKDEDIASALDCSVLTVGRTRRKCCELGSSGAVERKKCAPRPHRRKLEGRGEATLVATARDYAECLRLIAEKWFPGARRIVLVEDNLNTHKMGSLYERFPAQQAKALADRFKVHYTPKHGSWLNMAECEISVLARQCFNRRIPDLDSLRAEEYRETGEPKVILAGVRRGCRGEVCRYPSDRKGLGQGDPSEENPTKGG